MKRLEEICIRSILSLQLAYRCASEDVFIEGKRRGLHEREGHRKDMLEWLKDYNYYEFYTADEKKIYELKIGSNLKNKILNMYIIHETVEPLLWSIGLINSLTVPYEPVSKDLGDILEIGPDHSLNKLVQKCKLREKADIELQREISMLWHWRCIEGDGIPDTRDVKSSLKEIFGVELERMLDIIPFSKGKYPDFLVGKKEFRKLETDEMENIQLISRWRQHAYEWILGDEDWDDVETNT